MLRRESSSVPVCVGRRRLLVSEAGAVAEMSRLGACCSVETVAPRGAEPAPDVTAAGPMGPVRRLSPGVDRTMRRAPVCCGSGAGPRTGEVELLTRC